MTVLSLLPGRKREKNGELVNVDVGVSVTRDIGKLARVTATDQQENGTVLDKALLLPDGLKSSSDGTLLQEPIEGVCQAIQSITRNQSKVTFPLASPF